MIQVCRRTHRTAPHRVALIMYVSPCTSFKRYEIINLLKKLHSHKSMLLSEISINHHHLCYDKLFRRWTFNIANVIIMTFKTDNNLIFLLPKYSRHADFPPNGEW